MSNETNGFILSINLKPHLCIPVAEAREFLTDIDAEAKLTEAELTKLTEGSQRIIIRARVLLATLPKEESAPSPQS